MMRVVVARSAWQTIVDELDRVAPDEGVLLPLIALEHRAHPCAQIGLWDLTAIVLAEARCVPAELQRNRLISVETLPRSDAWADQVVFDLVRQHPRLRAAAYLHSHPFATLGTSPSRGDIDGHMRPLLERNRDAGLSASFSFIACRGPRSEGWRLPCFAMDALGRIRDLPPTEIVDDTDPLITRARMPRSSRPLLRRWRAQLRARGLAPELDELFGGWSRVRVPLGPDRVFVALFPVEFPAAPPQYHVVDTRTRAIERRDVTFSLDASEVTA